jgi:hypothetical protein
MSNQITYTLLPVAERSNLCSQYKNSAGEDTFSEINGYLVIDSGEQCNMQEAHGQIYDACKAHTYPQEIIDILKKAPARALAATQARADAIAATTPPTDINDDAAIAAYKISYKAAYDTAYSTRYAAALLTVVVDPIHLTEEQAGDFVAEDAKNQVEVL